MKKKKPDKVCPVTGKVIKKRGKGRKVALWLVPILGFFSLLWFLIRVIPKPSRITYPCQRVAAPMALNFLAGITAFFSMSALHFKIRRVIKSTRIITASFIAIIFTFTLTITHMATFIRPAVPAMADDVSGSALARVVPNNPIGVPRGIHPGRVVWSHNPASTSWNGRGGNWWEDANIDQKVVDEMISESLRTLTDKSTDKEAWDSIFRYFNNNNRGKDVGYTKGELIAIKVNMNGVLDRSNPGNICFVSPQFMYSTLVQLVENAGVDPSDIVVFDASRLIPDCVFDKCTAGVLEGVRFSDISGGDGRERARPDYDSKVTWSEDMGGEPVYLPRIVTEASYLINISSLKGHDLTGITITAKNHFGTIMAPVDGRISINPPQEANLHGYVAAQDYDGWGDPNWRWKQRPMKTYNPMVDLMGHSDLGEKTLLYMLDVLYTSRCQNGIIDNNWPSSIFISQDGVAIDSVGYDFLRSEPVINSDPNLLPSNTTADNYLHEAALAHNPPSGTVYRQQGQRLGSLGVQEHWNNANEKKYSGNLGTGNGIELVMATSDIDTPKSVDHHKLRGLWLMEDKECEDSSKYNHKATIPKAPELVEGKFTKALRFHPDDKSFYSIEGKDGVFNLDRFTIYCLVKVDTFRDIDILAKFQENPGGKMGYGISLGSDRRVYAGINTKDNQWVRIESQARLEPGIWYHIASVYDGETLSLYIDGKLDSVLTADIKPLQGDGYITIGGGSKDAYFTGAIDRVALLDYAVCISTIKSFMDTGLEQTLDNMGLYKMERYTPYTEDETPMEDNEEDHTTSATIVVEDTTPDETTSATIIVEDTSSSPESIPEEEEEKPLNIVLYIVIPAGVIALIAVFVIKRKSIAGLFKKS